MNLQIPPKVGRILDILQYHGYEAYAVGGCIRDTILARTPDDWDITTSAKPEEVKQLFQRTVDTGLQHGTVTVLLGDEGFEVTTYRIDGEYVDHRHPGNVCFSSDLSEDLRRRDFTINAMAYNKESHLVDLFRGMEDLQRKVIRCVGEPKERFSEDALRILRAVRFSAQLGFTIDAATYEALVELAPTLAYVSAERIQVELVKLLVSGHPEYIEVALNSGILAVILPEIHEVTEKVKEDLVKLSPQKHLRLSALLYPLGAEVAGKILRRLKFDNHTIRQVNTLLRYRDYLVPTTALTMRRALHMIGDEMFPDLLTFWAVDQSVEVAARLYRTAIEENQCFSLKTLQITGKDLIGAGMKPGKEIGQMLSKCLEMVIEHPECNHTEYLLAYIKRTIE